MTTDTVKKSKNSILIVEDQDDVARSIQRSIAPHYDAAIATNARQAINYLKENNFSLVLLDINLPDVSGHWLCHWVKSDLSLRHTPIIFLTGMATSQDMVNGLKIGADDYIAKPFKVEELLARTEAAIRRAKQNLEANPLTKIPGNGFIEQEIVHRIESKQTFSVLYLDLNHFKAFNDYYGFHRGDKVIQETSRLLLRIAEGKDCHVGHVGGDDFILICGSDDPTVLCRIIIKQFDEMVPSFHDKADLERGHITTTNRQGKTQNFPLLSIAIGVVSSNVRTLHSLGEVSTIGAEVKHVAKKKPKSNFFIDRRTDRYPSPQRKEAPKHESD